MTANMLVAVVMEVKQKNISSPPTVDNVFQPTNNK
jgi:hypothetical protein